MSKTWSSSLLLVERQRVLEAGAAAAAHADPQADVAGSALWPWMKSRTFSAAMSVSWTI